MKNSLHKLFSVSMAVLLLLSTISWTVEKHICMGQVLNVAWFHSAEDCAMDAGLVLSDDSSLLIKHCCDNESFTMQGQDDLNRDISSLNFSQHVFLISSTSIYSCLFEDTLEKSTAFNSYPPPILAKDLNILHQVFLI